MLAIEDKKKEAAKELEQNRQQNNSSTFFVTLQEAASKKPIGKTDKIKKVDHERESGPATLRGEGGDEELKDFNLPPHDTTEDEQ